MSNSFIDQVEVAYAQFNALKTLETSAPSRFEHTRFGDLVVTRDHTRPDSYYNRILGLTSDSLSDLDPAILWIQDGTATASNVRIDVETENDVGDTLGNLGFDNVDALIWLHVDPIAPLEGSDPAEPDSGQARLLTTADWPAQRQLLEGHGPIADAMWNEKRRYLCTDTFRWFGIFEGALLVSAASSWIRGDLAILGSAFTLPAWRGRGYQRRLLDIRRRMTPGQLLVDVAPDSASYRNCVRSGFIDLSHRQVWTREL